MPEDGAEPVVLPFVDDRLERKQREDKIREVLAGSQRHMPSRCFGGTWRTAPFAKWR